MTQPERTRTVRQNGTPAGGGSADCPTDQARVRLEPAGPDRLFIIITRRQTRCFTVSRVEAADLRDQLQAELAADGAR